DEEFSDTGTPITTKLEIEPDVMNKSPVAEQQTEDQTMPDHAPWAISRENAFLMTSMLQEVIRGGTGRKARSLGRSDIGGKTGTTNDQQDAWFSGFGPGVETTVYIGFDTPSPMGRKEVGGRAALPVWIDYMKVALDGVPEKPIDIPVGIVPAYVDKQTGKHTPKEYPGAMLEYFMVGQEPGSGIRSAGDPPYPEEQTDEELPEDIF
ncbi:MAG: peptidase, partial [Arenicellales bacterium]